jgi:CRP-like cAMP-binding protein
MGNTAELREFLVRTPFFGGLEEKALDRVIAMLKEKRFAVGTSVFKMGESGRSMYVIQSGELMACEKRPSGRLVKLMRMRAGDFFGETTLIEIQPRPYSVTVEKDSVLHELTNMDLYQLYRQDVDAYVMVLQNINRELCRRLRRAGNRLTELADFSGDEATQIRTDVRFPKVPPEQG